MIDYARYGKVRLDMHGVPMLTRQKVIIYMLEKAERPVSRMELTKWCFLLSRETPTGGGPSFYEFLPYHYGPYSFCLCREATRLVREGFLDEPDERHWASARNPANPTANLATEIMNDIDLVVKRFAKAGAARLVNHVYAHYPWFTVNSKVKRLRKRDPARPAVYTAGYEGVSVDGFLNMLIRRGIQRIIDVRSNPIARRYGFHKSALQTLSRRVAIEYFHVPQLGIESNYRRRVKNAKELQLLFRWYKSVVLPARTDETRRVAALMREKPSVLVCMEAEPQQCHRSVLADFIGEQTMLETQHLP